MSTRIEERTRTVKVEVVACDHCSASAETQAQAAGFVCCHVYASSPANSLLQALTGVTAEPQAPDRHLCATCWAGLAQYFLQGAELGPSKPPAEKAGVR